MLGASNRQPLNDFPRHVDETLDRMSRTGEAEVLTVDGRARAVLLTPEAFDALTREAQLNRDVAVMRQAVAELAAGEP